MGKKRQMHKSKLKAMGYTTQESKNTDRELDKSGHRKKTIEATGQRTDRRELENKDSELDKSSHRNKI